VLVDAVHEGAVEVEEQRRAVLDVPIVTSEMIWPVAAGLLRSEKR
jgi:hypothetical protein